MHAPRQPHAVTQLAFSEAVALRLIVLRSSICMRPDSHTQLPNNCLRLFSAYYMFLPKVFFGDAAFSEYFCSITVFSLYREYVVLFPLPDGVFLRCDDGLDF